MGPKKNPLSEDFDDLKKSIDELVAEVSVVKKQQTEILKLVADVKELRLANEEKDKRISLLEKTVADLEQYTRINDVIITGLQIKPRSYAAALSRNENGGVPSEQDVSSTERQVVAFMQSKGILLDGDSIEACHPLPKRGVDGKQSVIMRFINRKHKTALLKQGRKLKGTNVFINEHLTRKNAAIARHARLLRKQGKIQGTWTSNCKVFIKLNGSPEQARVLWIKEENELDTYK